MRIAMGILFLWLGAACLWLARADLQDGSPWGAYRTLLNAMSRGGED